MPIFGVFLVAATIQERPLWTRVQYSQRGVTMTIGEKKERK